MDGKEELKQIYDIFTDCWRYTKSCILRADLKTMYTGREW